MAINRRAILGALGTAGAGCLVPVGSGANACQLRLGEGIDARLGLTGDVMLGRGMNARWADGPPRGVWGDLLDRLEGLDGLFVNLECCLSDRGVPRPGRRFHFRGDPDWAIPALRAADVTWASLANNHVLDFGTGAFSDTLDSLDAAGVEHAGAGHSRRAAHRPSVVEAGGLRIAALAFTDRSPSYAAGADRPGTAFVRFDVDDATSRRVVNRALQQARVADPDLILASLHWGPNWETRPSTTRRRFARWLIDRGIDVVHGHSAHVFQGVEVHRGRPIIYDAGDFVDDYAVKPGLHNDRSFLFELAVTDGALAGLRLVPIHIDDAAVGRADRTVAAWLRESMRHRSAAFGTVIERSDEGLWIPLSAACG